MSVSINHLILFAVDKSVSASFLADVLGLSAPTQWGPFDIVDLGDGTQVQFATADFNIQPVHVAFLINEPDFDRLYARICDRGLDHWADPRMAQAGRFNTNHGGRGVYVRDPAGHGLEFLTAPYGSDPS